MIPASQLKNRAYLTAEQASLEKRHAIYTKRLAECNAALSALDEPAKDPDKPKTKKKPD